MKLSVVVSAVLTSTAMFASQEAAAKGAGGFSVVRPSISRSSSPARTHVVKPTQPTQQVQVQPPSQAPSQQVTKPKSGHDSALKNAAIGAAAGAGTALLVQSVLNSDNEPVTQVQQGQPQDLQQISSSKQDDDSESIWLSIGVVALLGAVLIALIGGVLMEFSNGISSANRRKI